MQTIDTSKLTFNTKAEYLEWRAAWRKEYAELSADIRHYKQHRKPERPVTSASLQAAYNAANSAQWFGQRAKAMMAVREASKKRCQELYLAKKAELVSS